MNYSFYIILLVFNIFCYFSTFSQIIQGKLLDAQTKEPLPFGSVQNLNQNLAVLSDLNGNFKIQANLQDKIKISYLGYETKILLASEVQQSNNIFLVEKNIEIQGITITSKDNPAYRYIRLMQQYASRNNPMNLEQFSYTSYNKMKSFPESLLRTDTSYQKFFSKSDFFLWETVTERKYKKPNKSNEIVKASRMSGLPGMVIPFSPTDLQDLSFYNSWVKVLGVENLSPIAPNAINHYEYEIKDTLLIGKDSILTIEFYPRKNKMGFKGNLKVHTKYYHLVSIIANMDVPEDFALAKEIKIQQLYEPVHDTLWFPSQLNTSILLNIYASSSQSKNDDSASTSRLLLNVESYIKDVNLQPNLTHKDFTNVELEVDQSAAQLTEQVLEEQRVQPLSEKEKNTYIKIDSLGKKAKLAGIIRQFNKLQQGLLGTRYLDIDLKRFYTYNWLEKSRVGLGLQSNEKWNKSFLIGAWAGYGLGDKQWKYGVSTQIYPFKNKEFRLHLQYEKSARELGSALRYELKNLQWLYQYNTYSLTIRDFYIKNWEYYEHYSASLFFPIFNNLNLEIKGIYEKINPSLIIESQHFAETSIRMRYAPLEKLTRYNGKLFIQENKGPLFWAEYRKGFNALQASTNHQTLFVGYQQKFNFHKWGKLNLWFIASQSIENEHLSRYTVLRTMGKPSYVSDNHTFNTLPFYTFTAQQQFQLELKYAITNPNFPSKKYSPDIVIVSQGYYGKPTNSLYPLQYSIYTLNQGYAEMGIAIFNLFPEKIAKAISSLRLLGIGFYHRVYGNYDFLKGYSPWAIRIVSIL